MREAKFTLNALLLVVLIVSAIFFFFSITLFNLSHQYAVNDYVPIEGTPYSVRYSSQKPNGIYIGDKVTGTLCLEGRFGYEWGAAAEGDRLYLNEYRITDLNVTLCSVVRVDTETFEKTVLMEDSVLRGRCASGELVCLSDCFMDFNFPQTNPLCRLYALSSETLRPRSAGATVCFLDPADGSLVYAVRDEEALTGDFEARWLARTLEEVRG